MLEFLLFLFSKYLKKKSHLFSFQSKDSPSPRKQVNLSRKRSHSTERRDSNERWRSETGEMHEWRHNSSPSDPAISLSPASSTSSLQHSFSQDLESSVSTETVIKKVRNCSSKPWSSQQVFILSCTVWSDHVKMFIWKFRLG